MTMISIVHILVHALSRIRCRQSACSVPHRLLPRPSPADRQTTIDHASRPPDLHKRTIPWLEMSMYNTDVTCCWN
ncbi:hypothetical protein F4824DRAFT_483424 [Ustulina deusta]|nr:hypothetical protein F4824DRAFT_483424 [Ustulina deusta]